MPAKADGKSSKAWGLSEVLFWPARILAIGVILTCPWYYGSVSWYSQSLYVPIVLGVFALAIAGAALRRDQFGHPLVWSLCALLLIALLQTVSLPNWLWSSVATGAAFENNTSQIVAEMSPVSAQANGDALELVSLPQSPRTLSINWVQTRASTATFAMALAWLIASSILFRTAVWEVVLIGVLAFTGLAVAVVGLLQTVAWNNWTLLPMPTTTHFATFVSRNSGPQSLAIGLGAVFGLLVWWESTKKDNVDKKYYVRYPAVNAVARLRRRLDDLVVDLDVLSVSSIFAATFIFVGVLAAASRGGIFACIAAGGITLAVTLGVKQALFRSIALLVIIAFGTLILLTTLDLDESILSRLDTVNKEAYMLDNGRFDVWRMILSQPSCWIPGCGLGNFHFAILPTYQDGPSAWFYHAENIYIELLAEFGLIGFAIGLGGILSLLLRIRDCAVKGKRAAPTFVAIVFAMTAIGLQSLVDFSLIIPGIFLPFVALTGCFLGRSGMPDFGKQRKSRHRGSAPQSSASKGSSGTRSGSSSSRSSRNRLSLRASIASFVFPAVLVAVATGVSYRSLVGFAVAEQISKELNRQESESRPDSEQLAAAEELLRGITPESISGFAHHAEVNIQVGRALQNYFEKALVASSEWPDAIEVAQRRSLSRPEVVAACFRVDSSDPRSQLKELVEQQPHLVEALQRSFDHFLDASCICKMDWRPSWGLLRSDTDRLTPESRFRNYAQLTQLYGHSSKLPTQVAWAALMSGENSVAIPMLGNYLTRVPGSTSAVVLPLMNLLEPSELVEILPKSPFLRAKLARQFFGNPNQVQFAEQLIQGIELGAVTEEVKQLGGTIRREQPWLTVAWLAERFGDSASQIDALRNAISSEPLNDKIVFQLAMVLEKSGRKVEALEQAERAYNQSKSNPVYKELVERLREN